MVKRLSNGIAEPHLCHFDREKLNKRKLHQNDMVKHPRHIVGSTLNDDLISPIEPYNRLLPPLWVIPNHLGP